MLPHRMLKKFLLCLLLHCSLPLLVEAKTIATDITVHVEVQGDTVRVDVELMIPAAKKDVWDVLTDFEHLPKFLSNITESKVLAREGNIIRISQSGLTQYGPLSFRFQSERKIILNPFDSFESSMVRGNMKSLHGSTRLEEIDGRTRIRYHAEAVPDTVFPLSLGRSLIDAETREHFQEIREEVVRRKSLVQAEPGLQSN